MLCFFNHITLLIIGRQTRQILCGRVRKGFQDSGNILNIRGSFQQFNSEDHLAGAIRQREQAQQVNDSLALIGQRLNDVN